jgi:hypothetical protein
MSQGFYNGCIHKKDIKLSEMTETYSFRCTAQSIYMKSGEEKKRCRFYQGAYKVIQRTIEDFFE